MTDRDINVGTSGSAEEVDEPEAVVDEYEQQLNDLLADVDDPAAQETDDVSLGLAGLELSRRDMMKAGAAVGMVGGFAGCASVIGSSDDSAGGPSEIPDHKVEPGEHDEYYGFWSAGHSGEIRIVGIPSMRELMRIPVFNRESARGYGFDDETSEMLEASGGYEWGDSHHPNLSETDGDYDGEYLWVNDKANGRIARVDLTYFETDAITNVPNVQAVHGLCVQSPNTGYLFGNGEFRTPLPNDGRDVDNPDEWASLFSAIDPETMETLWQVKVDGNLDIVDTDKDGRWAIASAYNSEEGLDVEEMTHDDRDYVKAFDVPAIEEAVEAGTYEEVNGVPIVDGTRNSSLNQGDRPIVKYVPTPKSPHCVEVTPDGDYAIVAGKLSPTVSIIDFETLESATDPAEAIVGQPKLGMGPLHTTFDGRGHGYTSLFIDSAVVKWDIEEAVEAEAGSEDPVIERIDVHYNPGHVQAVEAMTTDPQGDWLVSLNKLSKDRFLPVGPVHPDNDQLIYIGDDDVGMELVADEPVYPEPHDCVFAHKDKIEPAVVYDPADYEGEKEYVSESDSAVERIDEETVHVKTSVKRSEYGLREIRVKEGDTVKLTATNVEGSRDLLHGLAIPEYGVHLALAPKDTREATFEADEPGVYWLYCTYFCSALHLEMRSRLIVEPRD